MYKVGVLLDYRKKILLTLTENRYSFLSSFFHLPCKYGGVKLYAGGNDFMTSSILQILDILLLAPPVGNILMEPVVTGAVSC